MFARAERQSAVYKTGEEIVFRVENQAAGATYTINDGSRISQPQPLTGSFIKTRAEKPGFVLVKITAEDKQPGKGIEGLAGAAVEPEKIRPGTVRPEDFDNFWDGEVARLRQRPLEVVSETPLPAGAVPDGFKGFDVVVRRGEVTATGFLVLPTNARGKTLPAVLSFLGASKVSAELPLALASAKRYGALSFNLNFHGLKNLLQRDREAEALVRPQVLDYQYRNCESRRHYPMREIFLRTVIAADYVRQRPECDGRLVAQGGSLGGCQALVCAALVPEVNLCVSTATAMCDHLGARAGHLAGWPGLLAKLPRAEKTSLYFDVVNFAPRVKCPIVMSVGFIDVTCPPASTYAAYNSLTVPRKKMYHTVTGGHGSALQRDERGVFSFGSEEIRSYLSGEPWK